MGYKLSFFFWFMLDLKKVSGYVLKYGNYGGNDSCYFMVLV